MGRYSNPVRAEIAALHRVLRSQPNAVQEPRYRVGNEAVESLWRDAPVSLLTA